MKDSNAFGQILLVDDNPGDVRLIKEMFKEADIDPTIHVVSDGPEALEFLQQCGEYSDAPQPDVILLDLHLSRMDGDEVLQKLDSDNGGILVIAMSGSEMGASLKLDDVEDKVDACLTKPIRPEDLKEVAQSL